MNPTISIVLPVRNRMNFMIKTVESINRQTYKDWEIIIVDYGGDDETYIIPMMYPESAIRYIKVPEYGVWNLSRARNVGIRNALGRIIVSLDSDIMLAPNALEVLKAHIDENGSKYSYQIQRINLTADGKEEPMPEGTFLGCFQATTKDNFMRIRGFNELLVGYGWEDKEVLDRLERIGVTQHWLKGTKIYHQYHPSNPGMETWPNRFKSALNRSHLANDEGWGCAEAKEPTFKEKTWRAFDWLAITFIIRPIKTFKKAIRLMKGRKE